MKGRTLTVRLPAGLVAQIDDESRQRGASRSDIVSERLEAGSGYAGGRAAALSSIADLVGSVDGLPANLSGERKKALKTTGYGRTRPR